MKLTHVIPRNIHTAGFTIIELVIFIVVIGILASALLLGVHQVLISSTEPEKNIQAIQLAEQRMELILGQRKILGYANFSDPCASGPGPAICTLPPGYSISQPTVSLDTDPNFSIITVQVTGASHATLTSRVAND